mgnify:CR=1 FL=1
MRIGIFGGSFDPVHFGHLLVAEACREHAGLDRVLFVPAAIPPHKQSRRLAPPEDRLAMLELATGGNPAFGILGDELTRGGISWTVDTLARLAADRPDDELHLILGLDALADLPTWREPERILRLAEPLAAEREGADDAAELVARPALRDLLGPDRARRLVETRVSVPLIGIRSTRIRDAVAAGRSIRYQTPAAVERHIATHGLYRPAP